MESYHKKKKMKNSPFFEQLTQWTRWRWLRKLTSCNAPVTLRSETWSTFNYGPILEPAARIKFDMLRRRTTPLQLNRPNEGKCEFPREGFADLAKSRPKGPGFVEEGCDVGVFGAQNVEMWLQCSSMN